MAEYKLALHQASEEPATGDDLHRLGDWLCNQVDAIFSHRLQEIADRLEDIGRRLEATTDGGSGAPTKRTSLTVPPTDGGGGALMKRTSFAVPPTLASRTPEMDLEPLPEMVVWPSMDMDQQTAERHRGRKRETRPSTRSVGSQESSATAAAADAEAHEAQRRADRILTWTPTSDEVEKYVRASDASFSGTTVPGTDANGNPLGLQQRMSFGLARVVHSLSFELFWAAVIVSNSLFVGAQVHYMAAIAPVGVRTPIVFSIIHAAYAIAFTIEVGLRVAVHRRYFFFGASWAWNWFDMVVVFCSIVEVIFDFLTASYTKVDANTNTVRIIRLLRTVRLVRVFRAIRVVRFVRALRTLIFSIACTLRSLMWALILMFMILYVFAVLFTQAVVDHTAEAGVRSEFHARYWGSLPRSMLTLFQSISNGASWNDVLYPLEEIGTFWIALFLIYICFTFFAVLNVVTGVFCQSAIEGAMHDADLQIQETLRNKASFVRKAQKLFDDLDCDHSGGITIKELEQHMENDMMQAYFESLGIEMSDAWTLFKLLDSEESNAVSCDDFVMGCLRLKGAARSLDMAQLMYDQKTFRQRLAKFMCTVEKELCGLQVGVATLKGGMARGARHSIVHHGSVRRTSGRESDPARVEDTNDDDNFSV